MARKYELKRRAERQAETRRRIVEATIELHSTQGPGRTTLSDIARRAGVQRHTLYRHFPDERALGLACSGHYLERNRPPDPSGWHRIADTAERLRRGLGELYAWYEQVEDMLTRVLRDAEFHPLTAEMFELRAGAGFAAMREALAPGLPDTPATQAALDLALDFRAWKRLAASGLSATDAADAMTRAVLAQ
jgi:AcrR family transcriptional regulator